MDITKLFTAENFALLVSGIAILISWRANNLAKSSLSLNRYDFKKEFFLGTSKLKEILNLFDKFKNVQPGNISRENFENDKLVFKEILDKYCENEEKIAKASYAIPNLIVTQKKIFEKLQDNFDGKSEREIYTPNLEAVINYGTLFFNFSLFCTPFSIGEGESTNEEERKLYVHFLNLSSAFNQYKMQVMDAKFNESLKELRKLSEALKH